MKLSEIKRSMVYAVDPSITPDDLAHYFRVERWGREKASPRTPFMDEWDAWRKVNTVVRQLMTEPLSTDIQEKLGTILTKATG